MAGQAKTTYKGTSRCKACGGRWKVKEFKLSPNLGSKVIKNYWCGRCDQLPKDAE